MDQKRVVDVLLYDAGSLSVLGGVHYNVFDFRKVLCDLDASTPICVLARLDDPDVLRSSLRLVELWLIVCFLYLLSWARVRRRIILIFSFVPQLTLVFSSLLLQGLLVLDLFFALCIVLFETVKFRIIKSILYMKRQRQICKDILIKRFVVVLHIEIECLLVVHVKVVLNLVVQLLFRKTRRSDVSKSWGSSLFRSLLFRILLTWILFLFVGFVLWCCQ